MVKTNYTYVTMETVKNRISHWRLAQKVENNATKYCRKLTIALCID